MTISSLKHPTYHTVYTYVLFSIFSWTLYVIGMAMWSQPLMDETLRAVARVSLVLLPALVYVWRFHPNDSLDYLWLKTYKWRGMFLGLAIAGTYLTLHIITTIHNIRLDIPSDMAIWFNFIVGSPVAEELLFRGILFNELSHRMKAGRAMVISALFFAALHLPVWIFLEKFTLDILIASFLQIFGYGVVFAALMWFSKSLWTPIVAHWLNNLVLLSIVESSIN